MKIEKARPAAPSSPSAIFEIQGGSERLFAGTSGRKLRIRMVVAGKYKVGKYETKMKEVRGDRGVLLGAKLDRHYTVLVHKHSEPLDTSLALHAL